MKLHRHKDVEISAHTSYKNGKFRYVTYKCTVCKRVVTKKKRR